MIGSAPNGVMSVKAANRTAGIMPGNGSIRSVDVVKVYNDKNEQNNLISISINSKRCGWSLPVIKTSQTVKVEKIDENISCISGKLQVDTNQVDIQPQETLSSRLAAVIKNADVIVELPTARSLKIIINHNIFGIHQFLEPSWQKNYWSQR